MAKWIVPSDNMDAYISRLEKLYWSSEETIKRAVYPGAGLVADAIAKSIDSIPVEKQFNATADNKLHGISAMQKAGLREGLGIAKFQDQNGYIHVKIGMDGYNNVRTKKYPKGQPNAVIARSVESGTSFRAKYPFIRSAVRATKAACEAKIRQQFDEEVKKLGF